MNQIETQHTIQDYCGFDPQNGYRLICGFDNGQQIKDIQPSGVQYLIKQTDTGIWDKVGSQDKVRNDERFQSDDYDTTQKTGRTATFAKTQNGDNIQDGGSNLMLYKYMYQCSVRDVLRNPTEGDQDPNNVMWWAFYDNKNQVQALDRSHLNLVKLGGLNTTNIKYKEKPWDDLSLEEKKKAMADSEFTQKNKLLQLSQNMRKKISQCNQSFKKSTQNDLKIKGTVQQIQKYCDQVTSYIPASQNYEDNVVFMDCVEGDWRDSQLQSAWKTKLANQIIGTINENEAVQLEDSSGKQTSVNVPFYFHPLFETKYGATQTTLETAASKNKSEVTKLLQWTLNNYEKYKNHKYAINKQSFGQTMRQLLNHPTIQPLIGFDQQLLVKKIQSENQPNQDTQELMKELDKQASSIKNKKVKNIFKKSLKITQKVAPVIAPLTKKILNNIEPSKPSPAPQPAVQIAPVQPQVPIQQIEPQPTIAVPVPETPIVNMVQVEQPPQTEQQEEQQQEQQVDQPTKIMGLSLGIFIMIVVIIVAALAFGVGVFIYIKFFKKDISNLAADLMADQ